MGTREGVAAKIDAETKVKIEEMNKMVKTQQELVSNLPLHKWRIGLAVTVWLNHNHNFLLINQSLNLYFISSQVIKDVLSLVYDIKPELHVNYRLD